MADHVGGKRGSEVNLTSGCRRPVENVWYLSSLKNTGGGEREERLCTGYEGIS